jgi:formylglycine-generating enzyme required for sulfatase activity
MQRRLNSANFTRTYPNNLPPPPPPPGTQRKGTTCVGTSGGPSYFGTYDQGGNVEEFIEKGKLLALNSPYVPEDFVIGKGFQSIKYRSSLLDKSENPIAPISIMTKIVDYKALCETLLPTYCRHIPPEQHALNKIFVKDSDIVHLRANMLISGPGVPNNTHVLQITDDTYDLLNDDQLWKMIVISKEIDRSAIRFTESDALTESIEYNYEYVPYDENLYVQVGEVLVTDYIPADYAGDYDYVTRTLFVPESKMSEIRTGWSVYGDIFPGNGGAYVQYVGPVLIPFPETARTENFYEVVVNIPYDQSLVSFINGASGKYASVKIQFLSGFYGEDNLPGPFPQLKGPEPTNVRTNFRFAKITQGGSYETGQLAMDKDNYQNATYLPVNDTSLSVGFRIGSIHRTNNYTTARFYRNNVFGDDAILLAVSSVAPTFAQAEAIIMPGMGISGVGIDPDTRITTVNSLLLNSVEYITIGLDTPVLEDDIDYGNPPAAFVLLSVDITLSNPANVKDMVLVDEANNSPDGFTPGYGKVTKEYWIGKYPVTNGEYAAYLNHVNNIANNNTLNAFYNPAIDEDNPRMSVGIDRVAIMNVRPGIHEVRYAPVDGMEDHPVVGITWMQAARYCNWLHNTSMDWEDVNTNNGAYNMTLPVQTMPRQANARYFIPTQHEWYKAAYYGKQNGSFVYKKYPTGFDTAPAEVRYSTFVDRNDEIVADYWENTDAQGETWRTVADPVRRGSIHNFWDTTLFNKYAFYHNISLSRLNDGPRWICIFNKAMDNLDKYWSAVGFDMRPDQDYRGGFVANAGDISIYSRLKMNIEALNIRNKFFHGHKYNGIVPLGVNFFTDFTDNTIAHCRTFSAFSTEFNFRNDPNNTTRRICPVIEVGVNLRYINTYTDHEWSQIVSHELIHGLGFGTMFWSIPTDNLIQHPLDGGGSQTYISSEVAGSGNLDYLNTTQTYSNIVYGANSREAVPLESTGGAGTVGGHWENNFIDDGYCSDGLNCSNPIEYPGITNDLMIGNYRADTVISKLTVDLMSDMGWYIRSNAVADGEGDFVPDYGATVQSLSQESNSIQELSAMSQKIERRSKSRVLGKCSRCKK